MYAIRSYYGIKLLQILQCFLRCLYFDQLHFTADLIGLRFGNFIIVHRHEEDVGMLLLGGNDLELNSPDLSNGAVLGNRSRTGNPSYNFV